jgi:putative cell wall-binding protein
VLTIEDVEEVAKTLNIPILFPFDLSNKEIKKRLVEINEVNGYSGFF